MDVDDLMPDIKGHGHFGYEIPFCSAAGCVGVDCPAVYALELLGVFSCAEKTIVIHHGKELFINNL